MMESLFEGVHPIGETASFRVFDWEEGAQVIMVAKDPKDHSVLTQEFSHNNTAYRLGVPCPKPNRLLRLGNYPALVREKIRGVSLTDRAVLSMASANPERAGGRLPRELIDDVRASAQLLHRVHRVPGKGLRPQVEAWECQIQDHPLLGPHEVRGVLAHLAGLPRGPALCHGAPTPDNIFFSDDRLVLIDWNEASCGSPGSDLAELWLVLKLAGTLKVPEGYAPAFDHLRDHWIQVFLDRYFDLSGLRWSDVDPWILPLAARKLAAPGLAPEGRARLLAEVRRRLPSR